MASLLWLINIKSIQKSFHKSVINHSKFSFKINNSKSLITDVSNKIWFHKKISYHNALFSRFSNKTKLNKNSTKLNENFAGTIRATYKMLIRVVNCTLVHIWYNLWVLHFYGNIELWGGWMKMLTKIFEWIWELDSNRIGMVLKWFTFQYQK